MKDFKSLTVWEKGHRINLPITFQKENYMH